MSGSTRWRILRAGCRLEKGDECGREDNKDAEGGDQANLTASPAGAFMPVSGLCS